MSTSRGIPPPHRPDSRSARPSRTIRTCDSSSTTATRPSTRRSATPSKRSASLPVRTAPHSSWQNPYVERVIGSIRRECLDHIIVFNERHLGRVLRSYVTVLPAFSDAPCTRKGHARGARRPPGRRRSYRGATRSRRSPPSLRTASRLIGLCFTRPRREPGVQVCLQAVQWHLPDAFDGSPPPTAVTRSG